MKAVIIILCVITLLLMCVSCTPQQKFRFQACEKVYCESTEYNKAKLAGLKLVEIALATQNIKLYLENGYCREYYERRQPANGYIWANKSAYEVCKND